MKYIYPAIFNPEGTQYNVTFPDLPGCLTCGDNLDDALAMAKDVLCLWLYTLEEDHKEIPKASNPAAITTQSNDFISVITVDT
jgi:predicted RNase H-like HicB family nuclease